MRRCRQDFFRRLAAKLISTVWLVWVFKLTHRRRQRSKLSDTRPAYNYYGIFWLLFIHRQSQRVFESGLIARHLAVCANFRYESKFIQHLNMKSTRHPHHHSGVSRRNVERCCWHTKRILESNGFSCLVTFTFNKFMKARSIWQLCKLFIRISFVGLWLTQLLFIEMINYLFCL